MTPETTALVLLAGAFGILALLVCVKAFVDGVGEALDEQRRQLREQADPKEPA
jgi:hypothetical protein